MAYRSNTEILGESPVIIITNKPQIDQMINDLQNYSTGEWKHLSDLTFQHNGTPKANDLSEKLYCLLLHEK